MDEVKFVLKCFVFAAVLLVLTQIKAGDVTIESHIQSSLVNSKVADFVNKVADGGVKLIKDASSYATESYQNWRHAESAKPAETIETSGLNSETAAKPQARNALLKTELSMDEDTEYMEEE